MSDSNNITVLNPGLYKNLLAQVESIYKHSNELSFKTRARYFEATLIGGEHHHVHTHPLDFFVATPVAVLQALTNSGTTLLEPLMKVTVSAGEEFLGGVIRDVLNMRGTFDTPIMQRGQFTLEAILPVATSLDYPIAFRSMTSGKGTYASAFYGYQECPLELGKTAPRRGVNPLDRPKWILHARNAML